MPEDAAVRPAVPLDDEGTRLALEAAKAEYRQKIAQAEQARADSRAKRWTSALPSFSSTPLEGTVGIGTGAGHLAEWVALDRLAEAATQIATGVRARLQDVPAARILLVDDRALARSDWAYRHVTLQLTTTRALLTTASTQLTVATDDLRASLAGSDRPIGSPPGRFIKPPAEDGDNGEEGEEGGDGPGEGAAPPAGTLPAFVGAAADLVGFFRTDYTLTSRPVSLPGTALTTAVAARLATGNPTRQVVVDGMTLVRTGGVYSTFTTLTEERDTLVAARAVLQGLVAPLEARVAAGRAELVRAAERRDAAVLDGATADHLADLDFAARRTQAAILHDDTPAARARAALSVADIAVTSADAVAQGLLAAPADGYPPLVAAALRESLHATPTGSTPVDATSPPDGPTAPITHVLHVGVNSAGGEVVTQRSLFGSSGRVGFLGGVHASWLLTEVRTDQVTGGGSVNLTGRMLYDLATNRGWLDPAAPTAQSSQQPTAPTGMDGFQKTGIVALVVVAILVLLLPAVAAIASFLR